MRISFMRQRLALLATCGIVLAGCAGDNTGGSYYSQFGSVSGVVFDQNGNAVRNATVFFNDGLPSRIQTVTNSNGAYVLKGIPAYDDLIQCQIVTGGVTYYGENLARLYGGQRTMTVNISVYPSTQLASLQGTIGDSKGNLLYGAKIYAIPASGTMFTSAYGISDYNGNYFIGGLLAGTKYNIQVNGLGYGSAVDSETLTAGQAKTVNYTLPPVTVGTLPAPTGMGITAYTAPSESTTQPKLRNAIEAVKGMINARRRFKPALTKKMMSSNGSTIEIDVSWTPINNTSLLGYGIYRSSSSLPPASYDFLSDPLGSVYEDMDGYLTSGTTYTYAVSTVSTSYVGRQGESPLSPSVSATPLGPISLGSVTSSATPTFSWSPVNGAGTYNIFLFSQYPDVGGVAFYSSGAVSGTSFTYNGAALNSGQTYYYILGGYSGNNSWTFSPVGQFTVP